MSTVRSLEPESEREMVITRLVQAPRRLVWQAFTSAENLGRWWGPEGFRTTTSEFELRPGGRWVHVMHGPDGTDYPNQLTWREVVPPERLTYLHAGDDGHTFESRIVLEERGGATLVTMRALFPTRAERDLVVERYRADEGGEQTLGRLAALCEAQVGQT
ncbi:SRPBCC family protein [Anaeromyxobacter sp. Fw109-5]|uniref:SRPBCC family protein n=1 Tax=Anaeromyxobacter sp. (strain Fw109-5) TaxID=404589 RepID=UPI0000ED77EB|nr:SRPBCC family protein [Anaeromyxobacter sp. Fw109-5]ABS24725.1 Activator of Hsp90 ATPase 1 family protein [Anaeromyxobacter sp. Fw109-5]